MQNSDELLVNSWWALLVNSSGLVWSVSVRSGLVDQPKVDWLTSWMSYLKSLHPLLFGNIAHVGSFKGFCLCRCLRHIATQSKYAYTHEKLFVSCFILTLLLSLSWYLSLRVSLLLSRCMTQRAAARSFAVLRSNVGVNYCLPPAHTHTHRFSSTSRSTLYTGLLVGHRWTHIVQNQL